MNASPTRPAAETSPSNRDLASWSAGIDRSPSPTASATGPAAAAKLKPPPTGDCRSNAGQIDRAVLAEPAVVAPTLDRTKGPPLATVGREAGRGRVGKGGVVLGGGVLL